MHLAGAQSRLTAVGAGDHESPLAVDSLGAAEGDGDGAGDRALERSVEDALDHAAE